MLSVSLTMTKGDGSALDPTSKTAPENNIIGTLFSKSMIQLNETPVNSQIENNHLKSYFHTVTQLNREQMMCPNSAGGYYWEVSI